MSLPQTLTRWRQAIRPEEVFGSLDVPQDAALRHRYRELAAQVHPDRHPTAKEAAEEAFKLLQRWHRAAQRKVDHGSYGATPRLDVYSEEHHYTGDAPPLVGDLCDLYPVRTGTHAVLLKVVRDPRNNDLMRAEAQYLTRLARALQDDPLRAHFPTLLEAFHIRDEGGIERHANALGHEVGYHTLAEVLHAYPQGIPAPDMVWMWNWVLAALGVSHSQGIVHGAVVPAHLLLRPSDHNGMLVDWCYSVPLGEPIRAISPAARAFYPPEVLARQPTSAATDLYMAAQCMVALLGGDPATQQLPVSVPKPIRALLRTCLLPTPARRANDAWELFEALRDIARRLYGPPTFRPFQMPVRL